jgi:hypothetical protein
VADHQGREHQGGVKRRIFRNSRQIGREEKAAAADKVSSIVGRRASIAKLK